MSDIPFALSFNKKLGNLAVVSNYLNKNDWTSVLYLASKVELNTKFEMAKSVNSGSTTNTNPSSASVKQFQVCKIDNNYRFKCTISALKWLNNENDLLFGTDTGDLVLSRARPVDTFGNFVLEEKMLRKEHDHIITCLDVLFDTPHAVTGCYDSLIKVWDLNEQISVRTFKAHDYPIKCIKMSPKESHVFFSSGEDSRVLLWDTRKDSPAYLIDNNKNDSSSFWSTVITAIDWSTSNLNQVAFGNEFGQLTICDLRFIKDEKQNRQQKSETTSAFIHKSTINRVSFGVNSTVATCSDDCLVKVHDQSGSGELKLLYESKMENDFVVDLSWLDSGKLVSISWNGYLTLHDGISASKPMELS